MTLPGPTYEFTKHILERFAERFPGEDLAAVWARATHVPHRKIMADAVAAGRPIRVRLDDTYFRDDETGCMFTSVRPHGAPAGHFLIVTCWRFRRPAKRKSLARRERAA